MPRCNIGTATSAAASISATALPAPLIAHCEGLPRRLALVVHTLLAKSPADRPRTAWDAQRLLARSLTNPTQTVDAPAPAPFAGTLASVNRRASTASRLIAAITILAALGGLWFVWAHSTQLADANAVRAAALAPGARTATDALVPPTTDAFTRSAPPASATANLPALTETAARQIAANASHHGAIPEARIVRTERGAAIVALHDERGEGTTHLFMLEARGAQGGFRVTGHAPLDVDDFRGANWTSELVDADGDGYDEVLFTGTDARNDPFSRRLVLYVPRERQAYSLRVGADGRERGAVRVKWSANAGGERAKPFRAAMRERALADMPRVRS